MPYLKGETVSYAGIWLSQQAQDFYWQWQAENSWNGIFGANELCLHSHLQSSVIFDDHVSDGELDRFPVLLAGNTACISDTQAENLRTYVENGGVLFASCDFGRFDELGRERGKGVLDDFLGIKSRKVSEGKPTLRILNQQLASSAGEWVSFATGGHQYCETTDEAEVYARLIHQTGANWEGVLDPDEKFPRSPGLWTIKRGKGFVVYSAVRIMADYLGHPGAGKRELFKSVLTGLACPKVSMEGFPGVNMNVRQQEVGTWTIHLHNAPGSAYRPFSSIVDPGIVTPLRDLRLRFADRRVGCARSGLTGEDFSVSKDGEAVCIPRLSRNDVILVELVTE